MRKTYEKDFCFMENLMMKYHGFHPSEFTTHYLEEKMAVLQDEAPIGANIQATFSRQNRIFKGVVTILTPAGKFFAVASGKKLKDVTHKIQSQMQRQIKKWKDKVHKKQSIKEINEDFFGIA